MQSCLHSHAPSPISSHQPSHAPSHAPTRAASLSQDDDTQMSLCASPVSCPPSPMDVDDVQEPNSPEPQDHTLPFRDNPVPDDCPLP
jgi:hypothetical protein